MVCAFVTNELIREQTAQQKGSLLSSTMDQIQMLDSYKGSTINVSRYNLEYGTGNRE